MDLENYQTYPGTLSSETGSTICVMEMEFKSINTTTDTKVHMSKTKETASALKN